MKKIRYLIILFIFLFAIVLPVNAEEDKVKESDQAYEEVIETTGEVTTTGEEIEVPNTLRNESITHALLLLMVLVVSLVAPSIIKRNKNTN